MLITKRRPAWGQTWQHRRHTVRQVLVTAADEQHVHVRAARAARASRIELHSFLASYRFVSEATTFTPGTGVLDHLPEITARMVTEMDNHFDPAQAATRQVLALVEETCDEFVDAYLFGTDINQAAELADVLITAHVTGNVLAAELADVPHGSGKPGHLPTLQVLQLAHRTGRVAACYRRAAGMARRPGPASHVDEALKALVIAVYDTAILLGIDLDTAVAAKLTDVFARGWRQPRPHEAT